VTTETGPTATVSTRGTITRGALTVALLVLAGLIVWVVLTRAVTDQRGILLLAALLPIVAAGFLFVRRAIGATLAVIAALIGALFGFLLSICVLCPVQQPLSAEAIALFVTALVILALAVVELRTLRVGWVIVPIVIGVLALANNFIGVGVVVAAVIVWLLVRRLRSGRGGTPPTTPPPPAPTA
jgi:hypothetical protein